MRLDRVPSISAVVFLVKLVSSFGTAGKLAYKKLCSTVKIFFIDNWRAMNRIPCQHGFSCDRLQQCFNILICLESFKIAVSSEITCIF